MKSLLFSAIALAALSTHLYAAPLPYTEDYQAIAVGGSPAAAIVGGVTTTTNAWTVVDNAGNHVLQNTLNGTSTPKSFNSVLFPELGGADKNNFALSAVISPVSVTSPASVNYTAGLRFLAAGTNAVDDAFVADINIGSNPGRMRLVEWTGTAATVFPSATQSAQPLIPNYSNSKSYLLEVFGTYDVSNALTILFKATEVGATGNTQSYTLIGDTTPRTGQYFGFYDSMGASGGTMVVNYDNFSVVPEPATFGSLAVMIGILLARRTNRRRI